EATYDLHILLRFKLERALLAGALEVSDVPAAWDDEFEKLFGFRPQTDSEGCLQDIHWSMGGIGYFAVLSAMPVSCEAWDGGDFSRVSSEES
ncbi:hypothetical protein N9237_04695, partial [Akkermansiaceae bacterium]|nr:hypothetical protein [Akkermansiaceae bacterium]